MKCEMSLQYLVVSVRFYSIKLKNEFTMIGWMLNFSGEGKTKQFTSIFYNSFFCFFEYY